MDVFEKDEMLKDDPKRENQQNDTVSETEQPELGIEFVDKTFYGEHDRLY